MPIMKTTKIDKDRFLSSTRLGLSLNESDGQEIARATPTSLRDATSTVSLRYDVATRALQGAAPAPLRAICNALGEEIDPDRKLLRGFDVRIYAQGVCAEEDIAEANPVSVQSRHIVIVPAPPLSGERLSSDAAVRDVARKFASGRRPEQTREVITFSSRTPAGESALVESLLTPWAALSLNTVGAAAMKISFDHFTEANLPSTRGFRPQRVHKNPRARVILVIDAINSEDGFDGMFKRVERLMQKVGMSKEQLAERALGQLASDQS